MRVTDIRGKTLDCLPRVGVDFILDEETSRVVVGVIEEVRRKGDSALVEYAKRFDDAPDGFSLRVSDEEFFDAERVVGENFELLDVVKGFLLAADRVKKFHMAQARYFNLKGKWLTRTGGVVGQVVKPVESVCVYVPGGRALYPSTLIMSVVPARVAGVRRIYVSTPSKGGKVSPVLLYLCRKLGVDGVFKVGGACAVAAFAFGTQTVPKVDMIVGPGNKYFVSAKRILSGAVGIDMLPGPSEIAVIADYGDPHNIALDLLSQLEHDPDSSGYMVSTSEELLENVRKNVMNLLENETQRKSVLEVSVNNLFFVLVDSVDEGFEVINEIAPEHLEVIVRGVTIHNVEKFVKNAGTVLIGESSPVVIADYVAGTNHVLPTNSTARFSSPLGVYNFVKLYNVVSWSKEGLKKDKSLVSKLSSYEGLVVHSLSVENRNI